MTCDAGGDVYRETETGWQEARQEVVHWMVKHQRSAEVVDVQSSSSRTAARPASHPVAPCNRP